MPNIIFNIPLYLHYITTYIYTELALKLTATASVAQSVERCLEIQGRGFNSQPEALELGLKMYIILTLEFTLPDFESFISTILAIE